MDPHTWPCKSRTNSTNIQQLCEDTGCCPEDLPEAMNDREEWRERVRDIRATSTTWWWWWWWWYNIYKFSFLRSFCFFVDLVVCYTCYKLEFLTPADGFLLDLNDINSYHVTRTLLSILANLNNAVVSMFFTHSLISKSNSPCINPLVTVPSVTIKIGITVTFMFHRYFSICTFHSFLLTSILASLFLLSTITRSSRLSEIRWSVCI